MTACAPPRNRRNVESLSPEVTPAAVAAPARRRRSGLETAHATWLFLSRWWDVAVLIVLPLAIYLGSTSTFPDGWDYGEMQTVPYMLGITHPTGFPMFVLLGWVFSHVVPFSTVAWRLNLFCAVAIVVALLAIRALAIGFGANRYVASLSAIVFGMTGMVWQKAVHADVHALVLAFILTSVFALQRALAGRSPRWLMASAALAACGIAVHLTAIFLTPTLLVTALVLRRELTRRDWVYGLLAFIAPLLTYGYLPIRSWMIVAYNLDPNRGLPFGSNSFGVDWGQFLIDSPASFLRMMNGASSAQSYGWIVLNPTHWPGFVIDWITRMQGEISVVVIFLALMGAIVVATKRPLQLIVIAAGYAGMPFAIAYGAVESDVMRYLLPAFGMTMALAAVAPALVEAGLQRRVATAAFVGVLGVIGWNEYTAHRPQHAYQITRANQDAIDIIRDHVPDGAVVITSWLDLTTLGYGKYIDGSLGSRLIVGGWPSDLLPSIRALSKTHRVFVLADFIVQPSLAHYTPLSWQHPVGTWFGRDVVELIPSP